MFRRRKIKVLEELKERGDQIIDCGTEHEEWDQRLEDARAKFKQVCTSSVFYQILSVTIYFVTIHFVKLLS